MPSAPTPKSRRGAPVDRIYQSLNEMEDRLAERMDKAFSELKEYVKDTRMQADAIEHRLDIHEQMPNHPLGEQRLANLERTVSGVVADDKGHNLRLWQIVVAAVLTITSVVGCLTGFASLLFNVVYYVFIHR